jgi:formylglycine-generating enzyme required for sulfatase activity
VADLRPIFDSLSAILLAASALACRSSDPRPQLVVIVDTDAPVSGQLFEDPELSAAAAIDALRIDVLSVDASSGAPLEVRELVAPDARDWPLSFGIATPESRSVDRVRVRLRAFRGALAVPDGALLVPRREVAIDRLIELRLPSAGVVRVRVDLSFDCFGRSASFLTPPSTCVDGKRKEAPIDVGVEPIADDTETPTRTGTAPSARSALCRGGKSDGAVCIPGGFSVLGDVSLAGTEGLLAHEPLPLRPAWVSPFWLDATEITVGRVRSLVKQAPFAEGEPTKQAPTELDEDCTWLGTANGANDALPINCITDTLARAICQRLGGDLPSEAQWEHAARGRGQGRRYPWGDSLPKCCTTSAARGPGSCGSGVEPVASHPPSAICAPGDRSRDGVHDLGGSMNELTRDFFAAYDEPCWRYPGFAIDPVCAVGLGNPTVRGGSWAESLTITLSGLRRAGVHAPSVGFRCAYRDP